jgi:protein-S-isoprenylcysteine O-methyltransferase Ste14
MHPLLTLHSLGIASSAAVAGVVMSVSGVGSFIAEALVLAARLGQEFVQYRTSVPRWL